MADQLSGVAIIICIAFGVLTFLLLFIFANRQIKRFSLKSRSGPHAPTAADSPKAMQFEIDRRIDVIKDISYHPKLLNKEAENLFIETDFTNVLPLHLYRMKALDSINVLEANIASSHTHLSLLFSKDLRLCLVRLFQRGLLHQIELSIVHRFADLYDFARHEPGEFQYDNYVDFIHLLDQVLLSISPRNNITRIENNCRHLAVSSCCSSETSRLSNGKLTNVPPSPKHSEEEEEEEEEGKESSEKKLTYETAV